MTANNAKTAFRLPSGVNEDYQEFNMATPTTTASKKYQPITTKYQAIHIRCFKIYTGKDLCWSLFLIKFQVFSLQLYQKKDSDTGVFLWNYYEHVFLSNTSGRLLLEELKILLKTAPIAIPNDISKAYYQKGFVICFLRSTYGRYMEFLMETYNKGFSCSWIFSACWTLPNT